jgi:phosphoribosylglycinamide formyltransferase-1
MRIIGPTLLETYSKNGKSRIVNIHPSLLPAYPGLHAYESAYQANEKKSGVTIHRVDAGVDTGPILLQQSFERAPTDSLSDFMDKGKALEWKMYAQVLKKLDEQGDL